VDTDEGDREESAREVTGSAPLRLAARAGLIAYGLIHLLVAWLAIRVAFGGQERADQVGALQTIAVGVLGKLALWLLVAGFGAVVVWRLREAIWGFRWVRKRDDVRRRLFAVGQIVLFVVLAVLAARVAVGSPAGNGGQGITATVLKLPGGQPVVVAVGVVVVIVGVVMAVRGWRLTFSEDLDLERASPAMRRWVENLGRIGVLAKAMATAVIGVLIALAALSYQPAKAEGLDAALKTIAAQPYGQVLLVIVAAGLASYGLYEFWDARYHRV
jgi:hypothetical protein